MVTPSLYGRIRTTLDIDVAVVIKTWGEMEKLRESLGSTGFRVVSCSPMDPCMVVLDQEEKIEIELWLKPHGVVFDEETLKRRRKVKPDEEVEAWIISPEDFIVNKLARLDRGVVDEQDVKSVLIRQRGRLDEGYLRKRAEEAGVLKVLGSIQAN